MRLIDFIDERAVMLDLDGTDKDKLLCSMVERLYKSGIIEDQQEAEKAILAREQLMSTGVGNGIAIPHAKTSSIKSITIAIATLPKGINYKAFDKKKVHILFMLLSPKEAASENLKVLTTIAKILRGNQNFVDKLVKSESAKELIESIAKEEMKV